MSNDIKAFEKSSAITWTYGSLSSIEVTVCKRDITAAVVEPVGRKACWSARPVESGAVLRIGYKYPRMTSFSRAVESGGRTEIGRKSAGFVGWGTLGIGVMRAPFHWEGTMD